MPRFAANLSMMYTEHPFMDRFGAAAADGFDAVEYLFPYEHAPEAIAAELQKHGLTQALFNLPPGDWNAGERGMACKPERAADFRASVETALPYAKATGVKRLHLTRAEKKVPDDLPGGARARTFWIMATALAARTGPPSPLPHRHGADPVAGPAGQPHPSNLPPQWHQCLGRDHL